MGLTPVEQLILLIRQEGVVYHTAIIRQGTYYRAVNLAQLRFSEASILEVEKGPVFLPELLRESARIFSLDRTILLLR